MSSATEERPDRLDLSENLLPNYTCLREAGAIIPNDNITPALADWVATTHDAASFVFRNPELFSSAPGQTKLGNVRPMIPLEVDPPEHRRYRKLLDPFFSPHNLRPLEPILRTQINEFIDGFIERGSVDLLSEFFIPYPTQVFLTLYGLPLEDRPMFLRWKDDMIRTSQIDPEAGRRAGEELYAYMEDLVASRPSGGDDLLSQLLAHTGDGGDVTVQEILDVTYLFILAGLDTVTTALSQTFAYLARHPEVRQRLVADPSLVPAAVEEFLRIETPAPALSRMATEDVEVAGVLIRKGESVFCHLGAVNGDPNHLPDSESVVLDREVNHHASFGLGIHRCLGSHLARIEVRLVVEELHRRIPEYTLAEDADMIRVPFFEGLDSLPIVFPPGERA